MNYYFDKMEELVQSLGSSGSADTQQNPEALESAISFANREKENIQRHIVQQAFETPEQGMMELFIGKQQGVLTRLLNQLYAYEKLSQKSAYGKKFNAVLKDLLNSLLHFLRTHYPTFFNAKNKIPLTERDGLRHTLEPLIEKATNRIGLYYSDQLLSVFKDSLKFQLSREDLSYREADYLRSVTHELETLATAKNTEGLSSQLELLIIAVDFNDAAIGQHFTGRWNEELSQEDSTFEKLRMLKFHSKEIRQLTVQISGSLDPDRTSLKTFLLNWLQEEIAYYEAEHSVISAALPDNPTETKIHTSMSVPQLALFFRLLKADQLITNSNQSEFLKIVSGSFTTVKKEHFSYGHLHGKYYKIEASTRRAVYDMLMRLLHLSRKVGLEEKKL